MTEVNRETVIDFAHDQREAEIRSRDNELTIRFRYRRRPEGETPEEPIDIARLLED